MYNELGHYFLVLSIFVALTYNKRPAAISLYFFLFTISFFGILSCYISSDFFNYNVFTNSNANAPLFYKISGTWSNHEGSLLLWCWILSFYGFFLGHRVRPCNVSKRGRSKNLFFFRRPLVAFRSASFIKKENKQFRHHLLQNLFGTINHKSSLESQSQAAPSGIVQELSDKRLKDGVNAEENKRPIRLKKGKELKKKKYRFFFLLYALCNNLDFFFLAQNANNKVSFIDERRIYMGIALFFSIFLLASSNPFVRISFVCTKSLAELNPVLQDPILAIHPPCIYAGYVASAIGFCLCLAKIMNGISALYLPMRRESKAEIFDAFFRITNKLITQENAKKILKNLFENTCSLYPSFAFILLRNRSLLGLRHLVSPSSLWSKERLNLTKSQWTKRVVHKANTAFLYFGWTRSANKVVSGPQYHGWKQIQIWILTCWCFLTVGILLGSWWAYHELGWGGWWFWDPVENASFMPWLLATACIHSVIFPKLNYWTLFLNMVTFLCRVLGTFFVRSGLLTSVHSFATDSTRGIFLWFFFLNITSISLMFFFQMKRQSSTRLIGAFSDLSLNQSLRTPKPVNRILWYSRRSTLFVHLRQFTRLSKLMEDEEGHDKLIGYKASKIHKEKKLFFWAKERKS
uniref:Cytochrome c biogenesis factor N n=2 Tax=Orthotrichum TaxID=52990 RepID=A0A1D9CIL5_9BRYO|nr:cytochrome c biogenesis factor N [Orthotrichum gymnostomum]YP_009316195.1 cytochrome c biogenesis factor N [Orthotrichum obtusifolium]AOR82058.1 cytochrome c biogenesis factor N [Orthotrichum gymnostomum]AOY35700.1 cytochrome c biogenesis factor N [Orthotrichum obtusifolium]